MIDQTGHATGPILVPVDFSEHSVRALLWAVDAARRYDAEVIVLHVVHDPGARPGFYSRGRPRDARKKLKKTARKLTERIEDAAAEMLQDFVGLTRKQHPDIGEVGVRLVLGVPATRILEVASEEGASQIVMGSQGRTGLAHLFLGSKALRVAQLAPIPVTILKAATLDAEAES